MMMQTRVMASGQCSRASAKRSSVVAAATAGEHATARRAVLFSAVLPAVLTVPQKAFSMILEEDDEEMIEKAKANRAKRLAEQRATTRQFMSEEGLTNKRLEGDLIPVQKAVYKLAESGSQLEGGDIKAASRTLSDSWVADFKGAAAKVSTSSPDGMLSALSGLQSSASQGDLRAAKRSYVSLVAELQAWATASGLTASLKGL